jgi:hypothetical protein
MNKKESNKNTLEKISHYRQLLRKRCHKPKCKTERKCPRVCPCGGVKLSLRTSIAWEAAWTLDLFLGNERITPKFKASILNELNLLIRILGRHIDNKKNFSLYTLIDTLYNLINHYK